jgi:hypothetical protein
VWLAPMSLRYLRGLSHLPCSILLQRRLETRRVRRKLEAVPRVNGWGLLVNP